jgi:peptidoglycan lytic transglycosylase
MRPTCDVRARHALAALGAICFATALAVVPGTARSADSTGITPESTRLNVLVGSPARVSGHLAARQAGLPVSLQRHAGDGWQTVDRATTRPGGGFRLGFRPRAAGSAALRVAAGAERRIVGRLNAYRHAAASWYGPGLYGSRLACGGRLTPGTLGVAHKSLPCGARVTLRKGSQIVRVRVVDRGPYVGGREFDLTAATRARLHFGQVGRVLVAD